METAAAGGSPSNGSASPARNAGAPLYWAIPPPWRGGRYAGGRVGEPGRDRGRGRVGGGAPRVEEGQGGGAEDGGGRGGHGGAGGGAGGPPAASAPRPGPSSGGGESPSTRATRRSGQGS